MLAYNCQYSNVDCSYTEGCANVAINTLITISDTGIKRSKQFILILK